MLVMGVAGCVASVLATVCGPTRRWASVQESRVMGQISPPKSAV